MKKILIVISFLFAISSIDSQTLNGVTFLGGADGGGSISKFIPSINSLTISKSLAGIDMGPSSSLTQASNGKLYGVTTLGGLHTVGSIVCYDPVSTAYSQLKHFDYYTDGGWPVGGVIQANDGKLYGMTAVGGKSNYGVIYSYDPNNSAYKKLVEFDGLTGIQQYSSLIQASDGKLYGMTYLGGSDGYGVIFSFDVISASYTKIMDFNLSTGVHPQGSLVQNSDGKLYGTTSEGGNNFGGTIFSIDPLTHVFSKLYDFTTMNDGSGSLVQTGGGILYGMTRTGGSSGNGTIFSFEPSSLAFNTVHAFDGSSGSAPVGTLTEASDGKLYGVTNSGGSNNAGIIFSFELGAQTFLKLKDFDIAQGGSPLTSLMQASNGNLYGSAGGGANNAGVIFSFDLSNSYTLLKTFGYSEDGSNISGSLVRANNGKLYGMCTNGGSNNLGVLFSFDVTSSTYTRLRDFDYVNGSYPYGSLVQASDGKLYGMTCYGGFDDNNSDYDLGTIFSFDVTSGTYTRLIKLSNYSFSGPSTGGNPFGSLINAKDGKLYGMTSMGSGGYRGLGVGSIFSFDPVLSVYSNLKAFGTFYPEYLDSIDPINGSSPYGSLLQADDEKLYGMTSRGGSNNLGVLFFFDPASANYTKLKEFDSTSGAYPYGSLIQGRDGKLYGMAYGGGNNDGGVIFSYDIASSTYAKLHDFDFTNGSHPYGNLFQASDGKLYGSTSDGGSNDYGVIFSFDPITSTFTKLIDYDGSNGANPYLGSAFIELAEQAPLPVTLISFTGKNSGNVNELSWKVTDEQNLGYYELQRSIDGWNFNYVSQIKAVGKSHYTYDDLIVSSNSASYFYRLKIVDIDGNFKYSDVIKITINLNDLFVVVNPNPFKEVLTVTLQSHTRDEAILILTNLDGRELIRQKKQLEQGTNILHMGVTGKLSNGSYMLTIITSERTQTVKVVKSN